jgi:caspase domain-containing protein
MATRLNKSALLPILRLPDGFGSHMMFSLRAIVILMAGCVLASQAMPATGPPLSAAITTPVVKETRLALVVGNGAYEAAPLRNPVNDARDFAATLVESGFEVTRLENVGLRELRAALRDFGDRLKKRGGVGLFFFAGHGMQVKGRNYLIPVTAQIEREDEVEFESLDANLVLEKMDSAGNRFNIVILDACRNNPFARSFRSSTQGLAQMDAPSGTVVAFATSPGSVAMDGVARNGLYTQHLIESVQQPGLKIEEIFKQVRAAVRRDSGGKQTPWESTSLEGDFYFHPVDLAAAETARRQLEQVRLDEAIKVAVARERERIKKEIDATKGGGSPPTSIAADKPPVLAASSTEAAPTPTPQSTVQAKPLSADTANHADSSASITASSRPPELVASIAGSKAIPAGGSEPTVGSNALSALDKTVGVRTQGKVAAPHIDVGDEWVYLVLTSNPRYALAEPETRIDRFTVVDEADGKPKISYSVLAAPGGPAIRTSNVYSARPSLESGLSNASEITGVRNLLLFPMEVGAKWSYADEYPRGDGSRGRETFDAKVIGWESVSVPAGTFWALKVELEGWGYNLSTVATSHTPSRQRITYWYSPEMKHGIKWIVQVYCSAQDRCVMQSVRTSELLSFTTAASKAVGTTAIK